jgi:hypothetical protein
MSADIHLSDLDAQARLVLASCAPLQACVDALTAEINDTAAAVRPFVLELQKMRAPLVEIENERAAISRALGGRTGLFQGQDAEPITVERSPSRKATLSESVSPSDDARAHLTPEQMKRLELIEQQNLQAMQALQMLLQVMEDERGKREKLQKIVLQIAEGADDLLKKAG